MKNLLLTTIIAASALTATAQTEVATYRPGVTSDGITYFLPQTKLHIVVTAERVAYTPGEYCRYAERYLRLHGVQQQAADTWTITGITMTPYGEADKTHAYSIKMKSKTSAPLVTLTEDGRLVSVNAKTEDAEPALTAPSVVKEETKHLNPADYKTEEILSAGSVTKMAELTAAEIYDIRENRSLLTKGQADFMPKDGEQLRLMLAQLDTQEEALLQLFKGTTQKETHTFVLDYLPKAEGDTETLFRFSRHFGLVDAADLSGEPYTISITNLKALPEEETLPDGKAKKEVEDLRYLVPGKASVGISGGGKQWVSTNVAMAQMGRVEHLGGDLFNKKFTTTVRLSPVTGGIVNIAGGE